MKDGSILIGGFYASADFFNYLKKYEYRLIYDESTDVVRISAFTPDFHETDTAGLLLLKLQQVPEETVEKLARMLDLVETRIPYEHSKKAWMSRIPLVLIQHDGSETAELAVSEMVRLELPYHTEKGSQVLNLRFGRGHKAKWVSLDKDESTDELLTAIYEFAELHGKKVRQPIE